MLSSVFLSTIACIYASTDSEMGVEHTLINIKWLMLSLYIFVMNFASAASETNLLVYATFRGVLAKCTVVGGEYHEYRENIQNSSLVISS